MKKLSEASPILQNLLSDLDAQPSWRGDAAVFMAWRDNNQWAADQKYYIEEVIGIKAIQVNLIAPAMDSVYGEEVKHRVDWMVSAASEEQEDMAEAINHEMNDAMRLANANHACSEAYMSQASVGIGWVHVTRNPNPLIPGILKVEEVHRDEMFWDMRARSMDLREDCRWIARRRFLDKDAATIFFGDKHKDLIEAVYSDYTSIDISSGPQVDWFSEMQQYSEPIELIMDKTSERRMVAVYEVYYKEFQHVDLLSTSMGMVSIFDRENPVHLEVLAGGMGIIQEKIPIPICRQAWFIGPHIVYDEPSREPHPHAPYVPFFGLRADAENKPQGLIERMIGAQEQYNRAIVEIQRILRSRRIEKDSDALKNMNDQQALYEINRTDGVVNLRKGAKFEVVREWEKISQLEGICQRARDEINAASGIYQTFQGQTEADQSGIAVESIAELGAQSLAKIKANYQYSRKMVGDLAFYHIVDDIGIDPRMVKIPQELGQQKKQVVLNDGMNNRVSMLRAQVALQDIHTSAGYKQHTHQRMTSMLKELPDEFKGPLLPIWLESSEMPKKEQAIKIVNKQLGFIEDENQREMKEQQEMIEAEERKQLEYRQINAQIEETEASAEDKRAQAKDHTASALKKRAETAAVIREFKMRQAINVTPQPNSGPPTDPRSNRPPDAPGGQPQAMAGSALPSPTMTEG